MEDISLKKLGAAALVAGLLTASCAGHGGNNNVLPATATTAGAQHTQAAAPAGWQTTNTQALSLRNATDLGALESTKSITVRVGLQMQNLSAAQALLQSGQRVSAAQFKAQFSPTDAQVASVTSYLQSQGLSNVSVEPNNLLVSATGTVAQVQSAFNTKLDAFTVAGKTLFANIAPAYVPSSLGGVAVAVLGLTNVVNMQPAPITQCFPASLVNANSPVATPCARDFNPSTYWITYDVGNTPTGGNTTLAVMAEGDVSQVTSDLRYAETQFGIPQVPVSVVRVGIPSPDTAGLTEWDLDTQSSSGIAGNLAHLYIYDTTSLTDSDIALEYNKWVSDDLAQIGNSSFGGCEESNYLDGSMVMMDEMLMEGAMQGQTMFASSGDTGSSCAVVGSNGVPGSGPPLVEYPAASPYVVAVGGTTLLTNPDGTYLGETAWNAGGGGLSQFEYSPYWESGIQPVSTTPAGLSFRGVPDIAMDADPNTGGDVWTGGTMNIIGGTSLASPLAAGTYARLQSAHNNALGYAPPQFYRIYANNPSATELNGGPPPTQLRGGFHDILSGVNGLYSALPGYDYTTGLGTFDIAKTNALIGH
jgi:pseudomonalisin